MTQFFTPHPLTSILKKNTISTSSGKVVWFEMGSGKPLVLLHGGFGNHLHWVKNIEFLAKEYRVLVPDMPGFGESDNTLEHTIESLMHPLIESLHQLISPQEKINLVCFSFGGLVGSQLVLQRGLVDHLAILGAVGHNVERRPRGEMKNWKEAYVHQDVSTLRDCMRHNLSMHMIYQESLIDEPAIDIQTLACTSARFRSREISWSGGLFERLTTILASGKTQVMLIWGEHDVTGTIDVLQVMAKEKIPQAKVLIKHDAGHWVQFEKAQEINPLLTEWLNTP